MADFNFLITDITQGKALNLGLLTSSFKKWCIKRQHCNLVPIFSLKSVQIGSFARIKETEFNPQTLHFRKISLVMCVQEIGLNAQNYFVRLMDFHSIAQRIVLLLYPRLLMRKWFNMKILFNTQLLYFERTIVARSVIKDSISAHSNTCIRLVFLQEPQVLYGLYELYSLYELYVKYPSDQVSSVE